VCQHDVGIEALCLHSYTGKQERFSNVVCDRWISCSDHYHPDQSQYQDRQN
jgi:hypothetical protein